MRYNPHRLGVYLWRSSYTENIACSVFEKLARWDWLDREERAQAATFAAEELNHSVMLRRLAKEILPQRPDADLRPLTVPRDPWTALAGVSQAERLSLAGFVHMIELGTRLRHSDMVRAYGQILAEEFPHLAWGRSVLKRIRLDDGKRRDVQAYLATHPIAAEYRQVATERPWTD